MDRLEATRVPYKLARVTPAGTSRSRRSSYHRPPPALPSPARFATTAGVTILAAQDNNDGHARYQTNPTHRACTRRRLRLQARAGGAGEHHRQVGRGAVAKAAP